MNKNIPDLGYDNLIDSTEKLKKVSEIINHRTIFFEGSSKKEIGEYLEELKRNIQKEVKKCVNYY